MGDSEERDVGGVAEQVGEFWGIVREQLPIIGHKFIPMIEKYIVAIERTQPTWHRNLVPTESRRQIPICPLIDGQRLAPSFVSRLDLPKLREGLNPLLCWKLLRYAEPVVEEAGEVPVLTLKWWVERV